MTMLQRVVHVLQRGGAEADINPAVIFVTSIAVLRMLLGYAGWGRG